jgi:hypothetical protein
VINEGTLVKVAVAPALLFIGTELVPTVVHAIEGVVHSGGEGIVFLAAVLAAGHYLWKLVRKARASGRALLARIHGGLDELETLPKFRQDTTEALADVKARLDEGDKRFALIAETDQLRIKDAIAGDERSPVDRRAA